MRNRNYIQEPSERSNSNKSSQASSSTNDTNHGTIDKNRAEFNIDKDVTLDEIVKASKEIAPVYINH
jgi:hypothetical protein